MDLGFPSFSLVLLFHVFFSEQICRIFLGMYALQFPPHDHASSSGSLLCFHLWKIYLLALLCIESALDQIFYILLQDKEISSLLLLFTYGGNSPTL